MKTLTTLITTAVSSLLLSGTSFGETWTVDDNGKADFNNIQAAIDAASNGDEILVYPGIYTSAVNPVVNTNGKAVWLHSSDGPEATIISGENARTCIEINSGESTSTVIEGFTVSNGSAGNQGNGGGLDCHSSSPSISNCVFSNNYAGWGAGAVINNSSAHFSGCVFLNNTAVHDGGGMTLAGGSPVLANCSFIGNSTQQHYGGGVRTDSSTPSFIDCIFENNHGDRWGGAIMNGGTSVTTITNCTFSGNSCADLGGYNEAGGVYNQPDGGGASSIISNSIFCENTPTNITGVWTDAGENCISDTCDDCLELDCDGDGISDLEEISNGSTDYNQDNIPDECECLADCDSSGSVNVSDVMIVISLWGQTGPLGDVNFSGNVDISDLLYVIENWGECPSGGGSPIADAVQWRVEDGGNGHWYYLLELSPSQSAEYHFAFAESMGGHTATLASTEENAFCFNLTNDGTPPWSGPIIGVRKVEGTNEGAWVTGEPWNYSNWHSGEGNNSWERYTNLWVNDNQTAQWQDTDLTPHAFSIVEWSD